MDVAYTILKQEKYFRQFRFQFLLAFIGLAVYHRLGGECMGTRRGMGEIVILARYRVHLNIEHENLV